MSKLLAMFPGQGSQFVGMGRDLVGEFKIARLAFEEAEDAARIPLRKLCFDGPEEDLRLTANTQPCILTMSVAVWRVLRNETEVQPDFFAGHSLGEYSALVAAEKLTLADAVVLVRKRGEAMQTAVPAGVGAMAAVMMMSAPASELVAKCAKISRPGRVVEVANYNSPQQLVVAGHKGAVEELCQQLETEKIRSVMLPVSAPFHSSLMAPAREAMTPLLEHVRFRANETRVIANLTGNIEPFYNAEFLIKQINSAVLWTQSLEAATAAGCQRFLEVGPGKVLFGLARRSVPKESKLIQTEDIKKAIQDILS